MNEQYGIQSNFASTKVAAYQWKLFGFAPPVVACNDPYIPSENLRIPCVINKTCSEHKLFMFQSWLGSFIWVEMREANTSVS